MPDRIRIIRTPFGGTRIVYARTAKSGGGGDPPSRGKTGDPACGKAMSKWKTSGVQDSDTAKILAHCRAEARAKGQANLHRLAGNDARVQVIEHRLSHDKPLTAKARLLRAHELKAVREKKASIAHAEGRNTPERRSIADLLRARRTTAATVPEKIRPGQVFKIPESPADGRRGFLAKVTKVGDGEASIEEHTPGHPDSGYGATMPIESVKHFVNDLSGRVDVPANSGTPEVDALARGQGRFLGKGNDGLVFRVGNKVVKVSTTVPFHPTNPGHRTPGEAAMMLTDQAKIANKMRDEGIPGIPEYTVVNHGDKAFAIRDRLEIPDRFSPEQLAQVRASMKAIHEHGYALRDAVQVGIGPDGKVYHFDTGNAAKDDSEYARDDDMSALGRLYEKHGQELAPFGPAAMKRFEQEEDEANFIGSDLPPKLAERNIAIADRMRRGIIEDDPGRADEINARFAAIARSLRGTAKD